MAPNEENLANALKTVLAGHTFAHAARIWGVDRNTLRRRTMDHPDRRHGHESQQRLTLAQEDDLVQWILRQEALGYAPSRKQVVLAAQALLELEGDHQALGKHWIEKFIKRHDIIQKEKGVKIEYARVKAATPDNINALFDVYDQFSWIKPKDRYNTDEVGFMEGQGVDGLVVRSSQVSPRRVGVKSPQGRSWTSIIETVSSEGRFLDPLIIFKAASIQQQWFSDRILAAHPTWNVTYSENGWTSNNIALEWLQKVFIPQTQPEHESDARLLVVDGHGSHTTDDFMIHCFLNNIYLLFLPAHSSHVTQPLDRGVFSPLKTAYRHFLSLLATITDSAPVGKLNFLETYCKAREEALTVRNGKAGWRAAGLWPVDRQKVLENEHVAVAARQAAPEPLSPGRAPYTPKKGRDALKLLQRPQDSPERRRAQHKVGRALDKANTTVALQKRRIEELEAALERAQPKKKKKVQQEPNERFSQLSEITA